MFSFLKRNETRTMVEYEESGECTNVEERVLKWLSEEHFEVSARWKETLSHLISDEQTSLYPLCPVPPRGVGG
jgi:hypothetical protein